MKIVIVLVLLGIVAALASAGVLMLRRGQHTSEDHQDKSMARALALRVALSIGLFAFLLLAWYLGWIRPTGIPVSA